MIDTLPALHLDRSLAEIRADEKDRLYTDYRKKLFGNILLPAFSYATPWLGASYIIAQYNYQTPSPFVFPYFFVKPNGAQTNFCLCVRYRVGSTVTRFKLWDRVNELLFVDLYAQQIIKPIFCLEIWTTNNDDATLFNDMLIPLSILHNPLLICGDETIIESEYSEHSQDLFAPLPFNGMTESLDFGEESSLVSN